MSDRGKNDGKCYICKPETQGCLHDMEANKVFTILAPDLPLSLYIFVTYLPRANLYKYISFLCS